MQIIQTVSACQDVCVRDHRNEKSRLIPRGASGYQRIPEDATNANQETFKSFINRAIEKKELLPSATNLLVQYPRTSKFYLLAKIHKPGNPGRPIVSACQCLTELLASYLDKITAPLVRNLNSYVKDSSHMLNIVDAFRYKGEHCFIFTMDIKSLYTVIPNDEGLQALKYFLDRREIKDPQHTRVPVG